MSDKKESPMFTQNRSTAHPHLFQARFSFAVLGALALLLVPLASAQAHVERLGGGSMAAVAAPLDGGSPQSWVSTGPGSAGANAAKPFDGAAGSFHIEDGSGQGPSTAWENEGGAGLGAHVEIDGGGLMTSVVEPAPGRAAAYSRTFAWFVLGK
jgi:hypothetical protein